MKRKFKIIFCFKKERLFNVCSQSTLIGFFACFFISVKGVINMIMGNQMVFLSLFFLHLHELVRRGGGEEMTGCVWTFLGSQVWNGELVHHTPLNCNINFLES